MRAPKTVKKQKPAMFDGWLESVFWEYAFAVCLGIAIFGASGEYSLAIGVAIPIYWMREKNKRIRKLEYIVKLNRGSSGKWPDRGNARYV